MINKKNPIKILIVGPIFEKKTGGGITLTNLFSEFDRDDIYMMARDRMRIYIDKQHKKNVFFLNKNEVGYLWPFSIFQSNHVNESSDTDKKESKKNITFLRNVRRRLVKFFVKNQFLVNLLERSHISSRIENFLKSEKIDLIYSQVSSLALLNLTIDLKKKTNAALVVHVMDDHANFLKKGYLNSIYYSKKINKKFENLFRSSNLNLAISDYMSYEYEKRYKLNFDVFHNPIKIDFWRYTNNNKKTNNSTKSICYSGRLGYGFSKTIMKVANAISHININSKNIKLKFVIQSIDYDSQLAKKLNQIECVEIKKPVHYNSLPKSLSLHDYLIIPYDFEGTNYNYIKYSIPTKLTEFLATGIHLIIVAPEETAISCFCKTNNVGSCLHSNKLEDIIIFFKQLENLENKTADDKLLEQFNVEIVSKKFKQKLNLTAKNNLL